MAAHPEPSSDPTSSGGYSTRRKVQFGLFIIGFLIVIVTVIGELVVRASNAVPSKPDPVPPYNTAELDPELGWKMTPGYHWEGTLADISGAYYDVRLDYDANGFKAFGDVSSAKQKVMFIGDSYTASVEVSNETTFYNLIADSLDIEVFAYGHAGFGTLQEFMILDKWLDRIAPDLIVWQVCSNDFIDNYAQLEIEAGYKVGEKRPYLTPSGEVVYKCPKSGWQKVTDKIKFYDWLTMRVTASVANVRGEEAKTAEYYITTKKREYPKFDAAVGISEMIAARIATRVGSTPVLGFSADSYQPQLNEWTRIFTENGFDFEHAQLHALNFARYENGLAIHAADGYHWNEEGHRVVARSLTSVLQNKLNQ